VLPARIDLVGVNVVMPIVDVVVDTDVSSDEKLIVCVR
jgi:hypothetical protein